MGFLLFLQLKTQNVSLIEIYLVKNNKSTLDLLNVFLADVLRKEDFLPVVQTYFSDENGSFGHKFKMLTNGSEGASGLPPQTEGVSDVSPQKISEVYLNPETGGVTTGSRTVDLMEAAKDKVKDTFKAKTEDYPESLRPAVEFLNAAVDYSYGVAQALTDPNRITCVGDASIHAGNLPEGSDLHPKPCDNIVKRFSDSLSRVAEERAKKGK